MSQPDNPLEGSLAALDFRPIAGAPFGATSSADLRQRLTVAAADQLRKAFDRHKLLHFAGQRLSPEQQRGVMSHLGGVLNEDGDVGEVALDGTLGTTGLAFHSDLSFTAEPIEALSLHAIEVEDDRSTTLFANGAMAWQTLPADLRRLVEPMRTLSVLAVVQSRRAIPVPIPDFLPRYEREAVIAHPGTGEPVLYVTEMQTASFRDMPAAESETLLERLFAHLYAADAVYEHRWRTGDLLIWDNLVLQHARPSLAGLSRRRLQRACVAHHGFAELCPDFNSSDPRLRRIGRGLELAPA